MELSNIIWKCSYFIECGTMHMYCTVSHSMCSAPFHINKSSNWKENMSFHQLLSITFAYNRMYCEHRTVNVWKSKANIKHKTNINSIVNVIVVIKIDNRISAKSTLFLPIFFPFLFYHFWEWRRTEFLSAIRSSLLYVIN